MEEGRKGPVEYSEPVVLHTFHLARPGFVRTMRTLCQPPRSKDVDGLIHAECLSPMRLGAPILSPGRWQVRSLAMFAAWRDGDAVDAFLRDTTLGAVLAQGWHVRLRFLRRWGFVSELEGLPQEAGETDPDAPVVAVTLARLELSQTLRFLRWGKPVEHLVRTHPGAVLAMAASRPPRTLSTFTVWSSARQMADMVHGHGGGPAADLHARAMGERDRKDFHSEFTTLRFLCVGEYGEWEGRTAIVPTAK